jgi:hypothetical protein
VPRLTSTPDVQENILHKLLGGRFGGDDPCDVSAQGTGKVEHERVECVSVTSADTLDELLLPSCRVGGAWS